MLMIYDKLKRINPKQCVSFTIIRFSFFNKTQWYFYNVDIYHNHEGVNNTFTMLIYSSLQQQLSNCWARYLKECWNLPKCQIYLIQKLIEDIRSSIAPKPQILPKNSHPHGNILNQLFLYSTAFQEPLIIQLYLICWTEWRQTLEFQVSA